MSGSLSFKLFFYGVIRNCEGHKVNKMICGDICLAGEEPWAGLQKTTGTALWPGVKKVFSVPGQH